MTLSVYAQRHPIRAILLALLVIVLVDFSADDMCDCGGEKVRFHVSANAIR